MPAKERFRGDKTRLFGAFVVLLRKCAIFMTLMVTMGPVAIAYAGVTPFRSG